LKYLRVDCSFEASDRRMGNMTLKDINSNTSVRGNLRDCFVTVMGASWIGFGRMDFDHGLRKSFRGESDSGVTSVTDGLSELITTGRLTN
jgi:hypothetical protein